MVNAAIVGLGWWGKVLVRALQDSAKMRIVQGVAPHVDKVKEFSQGHGFPVTTNYTDILRNAAIDAIILATSHSL